MTKTVALVELPLYENTLPLASGYLQAYAQREAGISAHFQFHILARAAATPLDALVAELLALEADIYAISCYLWNMRRVLALLDRLLAERPDASIILGGPQVMNYIADYVRPEHENVFVCNGEGESTFAGFLRQAARPRPDFGQVAGLSFWRDGGLVTTPKPDRVRELDEIPSPFAAGIFDGGEYTFAVVETNRGCPFRCTYCYWGAATNSKVHKWETERVQQDLTWISEHGVESIFIADANWGALPRDVQLTEHIVRCKETNGYPLMVSMQAAKNRPDRVTEITQVLVDGGLLASQPVSLQTLSPDTLGLVERANIRESTYITLQRKLRQHQISSYTELIWPLPGETLDSFRDGIEKLCRSGADALVSYPLLLLHNTPMYERRDNLDLEIIRVADDIAEADVVVGTRWVTRGDFEDGVRFFYAVASLYNARAAYHVASYLDREGICSYGEFFAAAARYFESRTDNPICRFFEESVAQVANYNINNTGKVLHFVLHSYRPDMDKLLADFLVARQWWDDPSVRGAFELDLLARPYVYREPVAAPAHEFRQIRLRDQGRYHFVAEMEAPVTELLRGAGTLNGALPATVLLRIDHVGRHKMPYPRHRSLEHNAGYCQATMNRLRDILPAWTVLDRDADG